MSKLGEVGSDESGGDGVMRVGHDVKARGKVEVRGIGNVGCISAHFTVVSPALKA